MDSLKAPTTPSAASAPKTAGALIKFASLTLMSSSLLVASIYWLKFNSPLIFK